MNKFINNFNLIILGILVFGFKNIWSAQCPSSGGIVTLNVFNKSQNPISITGYLDFPDFTSPSPMMLEAIAGGTATGSLWCPKNDVPISNTGIYIEEWGTGNGALSFKDLSNLVASGNINIYYCGYWIMSSGTNTCSPTTTESKKSKTLIKPNVKSVKAVRAVNKR